MIGAALVTAPAAMAQEAVEVDQEAIVAPAAEDTPTPSPPPPPRPARARAVTSRRCAAPVIEPEGNNASMQERPAKEREARDHCIANPSRLLAMGGSEAVDDGRSWAWLPFLIAAVCTALVAGAYTVRRRRAPGPQGQPPPSLLEVVATIVAICAGVAGLAAQFVPGVGVEHAPAPEAAIDVRTVNARVTREEFARRLASRAAPLAARPPRSRQRDLAAARARGLPRPALGPPVGLIRDQAGRPARGRHHRHDPDRDQRGQRRADALPARVGRLPALKRFHVQFRLLQAGQVREIASTGPMRGDLARYACTAD